VNAAASQAAPFLRRSVAWLIDATVLSLLATVFTWRWIAPAANASIASMSALEDLATHKLVDALLAGTPLAGMLQALLHDPAMLLAAARVQDALWLLLVPWTLAYAVLAFAWHVAGDLSPWRGSPGKRWLGLRVETLDGGRPTARQAMLREAGSSLSWLTLNLGHALALLPPRRQSLHDRLAGTQVRAAR
jgi:uncharacterized RDD family membrane protein YckC